MDSLQPGLLILAHSLGWALLHSIWQALLVYIALRLVLKIIGNPSARLSYNLSFLALCGVFVWFLATWAINWNMLQAAVATGGGIQAAYTANVFAQANLYDNIILQIGRWLPFIAAMYFAGLVLFAIRFVYNYAALQAYKKKGIIVVADRWLDKLAEYKERLQVRGNVSLLFSEYITVPMVTGFFKPLILVPVATVNQLTAEQLEAILVHELAHIKRQDYLFNMVQSVMETVLFFNPFAWALSAIIRREREHCCDDIVLEHTQHPLSYAHALTSLETARQSQLALSATGNKKLLFNRIKRIMEMKKNTIGSPAATVLFIAGLVVSLIWLTPVIAQTKKSRSTKDAVTPVPPVPPTTGKAVVPAPPAVPSTGKAAPVPPVPPVPPVAPIAPIDVSGITDTAVTRAMEAANQSIAEANKALGEIDWKEIGEEMANANKEVKQAMAEIDWKEINEEIVKANKEVKQALADIDWKEINAEIAKATKEATTAIKEIDWKEINEEVMKAQKEAAVSRQEAEKARKEAEHARKEGENARHEGENARKEADKARKQADKAIR